MLSSSCQSSNLKRKRLSSEHKSDEDQDIENLPKNEEKKYKDDSRVEASCSFEREGERRQPFSELKIVKDSNIESLVSDQERLSLSDVETNSPLGSCDVARLSDLSPSASPCPLTPGTSSVQALSNYQYEDLRLDRLNPLPPMSWADLPTLWQLMCDKDEESLKLRDSELFAQHPSLQFRMRSVLLDWIMEVCEVYKLHRETYHLTLDYIDRYLSSQTDIPKQQLQLIGITCLQLAAKNEEIYPPKMVDFAYVTDGACSEAEILAKELVVCEALGWLLNPVTPLYWLKVFLQIAYQNQARHDLGFYFPQFSPTLYTRVATLLDFCTLDVGSLRFSYSVLAAAAIYLACSTELAVQVSGLAEEDIMPCVDWMSVFWKTLKDENTEYSKKYSRLPPGITKAALVDDSFNLQKHDPVNLPLLDSALEEAAKSCLLTPPSSSKKSSVQTDRT
ncbi:G1/S-specific cyclin-E1-like isoform X3 [Macrosteles quadrilineatus]|nr:G1/S-specific cyclin-E1-like isoform X3 [Macrosteles quadrilineatus]